MAADSEELENLDASEIDARRLKCEGGSHAEKMVDMFTVAVGTVKLSGRDPKNHFHSGSITLHEAKNTTTFFRETRTGLSR